MKRILTMTLLFGGCGIFMVTLCAAQSNEVQQGPVVLEQLFASPDEAVKALQVATETKNEAALNEIFGPQVKELLTGDKVQDAKNALKFATVMAQGYTLVKEGDDKITIEIGTNNWSMPIPLVKADGQWYFDTAAGKEEIINRHIGKDELHAIGVCRYYVTAQQLNKVSPLGSLLAAHPFHGYYFRILTRQGNGHLTKGFALVAYPVNWDRSGIMTFIVNQDGKVYQRNFAEKTFQIASAMEEYNPDSGWTLVQDEGVVFSAVSEK